MDLNISRIINNNYFLSDKYHCFHHYLQGKGISAKYYSGNQKSHNAVKKRRILVIDNYDSFTFNLVQLLGYLNQEVILYKNDALSDAAMKKIKPDMLLISPGPGRPEDSKASLSAIEYFYDKVSVLGVCLGHQAIGYVFGCRIINAPEPVHGKITPVYTDKKTIFRNVKTPFSATRYHSLLIDRSSLPRNLTVSAETDTGLIMGIRHNEYPVEGIQFHPESVLTSAGIKIISNWINN